MDERSRALEILKLRSVIVAESSDFRTVYRRLAELLVAAGERREAASIALAAADRCWSQRSVFWACEFLQFARECAPYDLLVYRAYLHRRTAILAFAEASRAASHAPYHTRHRQ